MQSLSKSLNGHLIIEAEELLWAGEGFSAFAAVSASSSELHVQFIDMTGAVAYSYSIERNGTNSSNPTAFPTMIMTATPSLSPTEVNTEEPTVESTQLAEDVLILSKRLVVFMVSSFIFAMSALGCCYGLHIYMNRKESSTTNPIGDHMNPLYPEHPEVSASTLESSSVEAGLPTSPLNKMINTKPFYQRCVEIRDSKHPRHRRQFTDKSGTTAAVGGAVPRRTIRMGRHATAGKYSRALDFDYDASDEKSSSQQSVYTV